MWVQVDRRWTEGQERDDVKQMAHFGDRRPLQVKTWERDPGYGCGRGSEMGLREKGDSHALG